MKNRFKRIISLGITMIMTVSILCGCGNQDASELAKAMMESDAFKEALSGQNAEGAVSDNTMPKQEETQLSENENMDEEQESIELTGSADDKDLRTAKIRYYYSELLSQFYYTSTLPDINVEPIDYNYHEISENHYAIVDIDGDGEEELIIEYTTASMAGHFEVVYSYNPDTDSLSREYLGTMDVQFYDNGMIIEYASHNHTYCLEFWPYRMAQYKNENDTYQDIANVSAWDKNDENAYSVVDEFPDQYDIDGDGILYSIAYATDTGYESEDYKYDKADYDKWYESYLGGANEIMPEFKSLEYNNFKQYAKEYLDLLANRYREKSGENYTDIGEIFFNNDLNMQSVEKYLEENYEFVINEDIVEESVEDNGIYNGEEIFRFDNMNLGTITYKEKKVEDITIFGLYPGMDEQDALKYLDGYGFYQTDLYYMYEGKTFITGKGIENRFLRYETDNGKITSIVFGYHSVYVG